MLKYDYLKENWDYIQAISIEKTYLWLFQSFNFFQDHILQELNYFMINWVYYFFEYTQILFQFLESSNSFINLFNNLHWKNFHNWLKLIRFFLLWIRNLNLFLTRKFLDKSFIFIKNKRRILVYINSSCQSISNIFRKALFVFDIFNFNNIFTRFKHDIIMFHYIQYNDNITKFLEKLL